jgi:O-antigen/teichoic acid export membrane protein
MKNMSAADRIIRLLVAAAIGILYLAGILSGTWAIVLGIVAVIFLVTGLVGVCPLYMLFHFSTLRKE